MDKVLLDNGMVKVVETREIPRYVGMAHYCQATIDMFIDDLKEQNKIWTTKSSREGFEVLDTKEDWEPEGESVVADIESFQKYLDDTYGKDKYEAYALGAYIHSAVSFSISKGPDNRCRWDSGTVGFIGINKENEYNISKLASDMTDCWNGSVVEYYVWDNYEDCVLDDEYWDTFADDKDLNEWKDKMAKEYNIDWDKVKVE